jgi:uncharacterized protein (TIGR02588 family)
VRQQRAWFFETMTRKAAPQRGTIPASEWAAAGIGAALVLASIAILVYSAATSQDSPPRLALRVDSIQATGDQFLVLIEIANEGGSTAADARIEAELRQQGTVIEHSETTVDFIPRNSKRQAGVFFGRDPRTLELTLRTSGYRDP